MVYFILMSCTGRANKTFLPFVVFLFCFSSFVWGESLTISNAKFCTLEQKMNTVCKILITDLRPTQFSYGPLQMATQRRSAKALQREDKLIAMQSFYAVPIIIGLDQFFLTDKHHHTAGLAFLKSEEELYVLAHIVGRLQNRTEDQFWKQMVENHSVWLFDVAGRGPMDPSFLPHSLTDMYEDPYRDIAYEVSSRGGYQSLLNIYYQEFHWANYLRKYIPYPQSETLSDEMKAWCAILPYDSSCNDNSFRRGDWTISSNTLANAMYYAQHTNAADLPGYIGPGHA